MMKAFLPVLSMTCVLSIAQGQGRVSTIPVDFEVASVKIAKDSAAAPSIHMTPGRFGATNVPLRLLILSAYKLQRFQLEGGPGWVGSERYNIEATTDPANGADAMLLMLQHLLETRFKLHLHREMKEGPVYLLTVAKSGSKLRPAECVPFDPNNLPKQVALSSDERKRQCTAISRGTGELDAGGMPMEDATGPANQSLTGQLTLILERPVLNKTGITGIFEVHLRWIPVQSARPEVQGDPVPTDASATGPSVFTAVQEQLGLRLESAKAPFEVFVVDHIERPNEN